MIYCKKCIMPNTRPGIIFDDNGVCSPCNWSEKKRKLIGNQEKKIYLIFATGQKNFQTINGVAF